MPCLTPLELTLSIVRILALVHVSATALLVLVFLAVVLWQRLTPGRPSTTPLAVPSEDDRAPTAALASVLEQSDEPVTAAAPAPATSGASVLQWQVDLRAEDGGADARRVLQRSS